ncbi:hypothetical protein [Acidovorax sp. BLS4]|uniref:hypothetical protein n=1 Tax=Acidovorax sp. BLS4 TaxID=3273430 RepID=UPI0029437576|nr:hypothetical protein [Paracidovorax avenae]WOI45479.1 hypothetical protein R1Z03_23700 [Paracidovorax avenae]
MESTSKQKAGATKKETYRASILNAFEQLAADRSRKSLSVEEVCKQAGLTSSPIYKPHHDTLRAELELKIKGWNLSRGKKKRRAATETEQDVLISNLKAENSLLKIQLRNTQDALNILGQMLETALGNGGASTVVPLRAKIPKAQ